MEQKPSSPFRPTLESANRSGRARLCGKKPSDLIEYILNRRHGECRCGIKDVGQSLRRNDCLVDVVVFHLLRVAGLVCFVTTALICSILRENNGALLARRLRVGLRLK